MRRRSLRLIPALALAAVALATALRADAPHGVAARGPLLVTDSAGAVSVRTGGAGAIPLALPPQSRLGVVAGDAHSWVAAGTRLLPGGKGSELVLALGDAASARTVQPPAGRTARERASPQPLLERGELAGLLWLEGTDRGHYAVRAALWDGERWSRPETVSPVAQGTQIAPAVAVLADGTWLAVWSRFNGHDDDVVWSVRRAGGWTEPRAVHAENAVPDITPAVLATGRGALIAWNTFDGSDYRLALARFERGEVSPAETLGGPGWLYPDLAPAGGNDGALVRCLQADPQSWVVLEVDAEARVRRVASAAVVAERGRPLLRAGSERGVAVTWSGDATDETLPWRLVP
jgi:hypothetical protein